MYEGLMALTNLSSTSEGIRDKIVTAGAWKHCSDMLSLHTKENNSADD